MVIYIILAMVVGSYLYYSEFYIPNKENLLINKGVRTLANIEEGIYKKEEFLQSFMDQRLNANTMLDIMDGYATQSFERDEAMMNWDSIVWPGCDSCDLNLWRVNAQRTIIRNHVKPLPIEPGDWQAKDPPIVFNPGQYGHSPYLEIKHVRSEKNDLFAKALKEQKKLLARATLEEKEVEMEELNKLLKEAKEYLFVKDGDGYGYPTRFESVPSQRADPSWEESHTGEESSGKLIAKITLDTLLQDVMDNEIFECMVLHSVKGDRVYFSSLPSLISPKKKFENASGDSIVTRFGVNIFEIEVNSKPYVEFRRFLQLGDKTVYLSGFISREAYDKYLREIDYFLLILVVLSTFTLVGAVPLIKVFVINEWERLRDRDVLFSALSLLVVVFLGSLIFSTVHHYSEVEHKVEEDLENYASRLEFNFSSEVSELVRNTGSFEFGANGYWKNGDKFLFHEFFETNDGTINRIVLPYDEYGSNWDTVSDIGRFFRRFVNLGERDYIQKIRQNDAYVMVQPNQDSVRLFLESVFSYSRAQKEAVISYPKGDQINGVSVDLKSMMWTIPPEGYGYALIDRDMKVLFSSKKSKNNFKNLRTDLVGSAFISQSIAYGQPLGGHFDFGRDKFLGYVKPINSMLTERGHAPALFLVTFANHDLVEWHTGLTSLLSAMASFGILFASFLLLLLQSLFYINQKDARFFRKSNFYDSIFPDRKDGLTYVFLSTISLLGIIIGAVLYEYGLSALIRYGIVQVLLFGLLRPLLLSYNDSAKGRSRRRGYFLTTFVILVSAICLLPGGSSSKVAGISTDQVTLMVYASMAIVLALLVHRQLQKSKDKPFALKRSSFLGKLKFVLQSKSVKNIYIFSMYAWILAILVLPFILISDKCEEIVANSFKTLSSAQINEKLVAEKTELLSLYEQYHGIDTKVSQLQLDGDWKDFMIRELNFGTDISQKAQVYHYGRFFQPIFELFASRYSYDPLYVPARGKSYFENGRVRTFVKVKGGDADNAIGTSTTKVEYNLTNIVFFVFSLLLLYVVVRLFLNRIVFNISKELQGGRVRAYSIIDSLEKYRAHKLEHNQPLRLFLVGIPRSRRTTILQKLELYREDLGFIDFGRNTSFLDGDYDYAAIPIELAHAKAIVIRFWFPENITETYLNRLRNLTRYMEETELYQKGSIILSDLTITQIEDKWYEMKSAANTNSAANEVMLYLKEWFRSYREFLLPLEKERFEDSEAINGQIGFNDAYDDYLNKSYYSPIYFSLWHSLSLKERFIIYDLAEDGLLNARDSFMLMKLKRKGILSYNRGTYRMELFHRSFTLFVKHGVSTEEIMAIELFSKKNGSWGQIRLALLLLILALLLFINTLMPNMFNALISAIGVIASFSGAISQLSGKFSMPQFGKLFGKE